MVDISFKGLERPPEGQRPAAMEHDSSRRQIQPPLPIPPPPIPSSQTYKTHTDLGKAQRGSTSRSNEQAKARQEGGRQQEKKWKTQAVLVWVCGKVALGREAVKGAFCPSCARPWSLGFYISKRAGDVLATCKLFCFCFLGLLDKKCRSFGIKFGEGRRQRLRKSLHN